MTKRESLQSVVIEDLDEVISTAPEQKWYQTRKFKFGVATALGCSALVGIVAAATGSDSATGPVDSDNNSGDVTPPEYAFYEFPVASFGVQAEMGQYPGGPPSFPSGLVSLGPDNVLTWTLSGLTPSQQGGIHIHTGMTCETAGGHFYQGPTDGWNDLKWTTDVNGTATGSVDVDFLAGGYPYADNVGRTVVIHDESGVRVACGKLAAKNIDNVSVRAKLLRYPGLNETVAHPSGYVFLSKDNILSWNMAHLQENGVGGIHIHQGLTCETAGPHFFSGSQDGWNDIFYTASSTGTSSSSVNLTEYDGIYPFEANVDHAVVVHAPDGTRVACGVLHPYHVMQVEEELEEGDYDYYSVGGSFVQYPGGPETHPTGRVWLDSNNVLSWSISGLEADVSGGLHIHAGRTCADSGPHHWDKTAGPDPWNDVKYTSDDSGESWGKIDVDDLPAAFSFVSNLDRTVVIHSASGARVACAELKAREDYGAKALMGRYPGGTMDFPRGRVSLDGANVLTWHLFGLEENSMGGIHIHQGKSCDFSQGHHFDAAKSDGWMDTYWYSNSEGTSRGMITVDKVEGAFSFDSNVDRVIVLHNAAGQRIACGKLLPYVFHPDREEDDLADVSFEFEAKGSFSKYPRYTGGDDYPLGRVSLDSDGILTFHLHRLEPNSHGGIHIHVGKKCYEAQGHHYKGSVDGWNNVFWSSKKNGKAFGMVDLKSVPGAYHPSANLEHAVVVHRADGTRVSCTELHTNHADFGVVGYMKPYPGVPEDIAPQGMVFLSKDNVMTFFLQSLPRNAPGAIHIHQGFGPDACENSGPHWFTGAVDGWNSIVFKSDGSGNTRGVVDLNAITGLYPFADNVYHAVVVHGPDGARIGCSVLGQFEAEIGENKDQFSEMYDEREGRTQHVVASGTFSPYPGLSKEDAPVEGTVYLNDLNELTFDLKFVRPSARGGFHIHEGMTCEMAGDHWYTGAVDGWKVFSWYSDSEGRASSIVDVDNLIGGYNATSNYGHAVVLHDSDGTRFSCATLVLE